MYVKTCKIYFCYFVYEYHYFAQWLSGANFEILNCSGLYTASENFVNQ